MPIRTIHILEAQHEARVSEHGIHTLDKVSSVHPQHKKSHRITVRNFELCGLQRKHLKLNLQSSQPFCLLYFEVHLDNQKGWQNQHGGGDWNHDLLSTDLLPRFVCY